LVRRFCRFLLRASGSRRKMSGVKHLRRAAAVVVTAGLAAVSPGAPAWGPKYILGASAFGTCALPDGPAAFQGDFRITSFGVTSGGLVANAFVVGSCAGPGVETAATVRGPAVVYPIVSVVATCDPAHAVAQFRPGTATVGGFLGADEKTGEAVRFPLNLAPSTVVERMWSPGDPASLRAQVCAVARLLPHAPPQALANVLNSLVIAA
jgi:hypothetical protein